MPCQHLKLQPQPRILDADKARTVSILNEWKNESRYDLSREKVLEIDEV